MCIGGIFALLAISGGAAWQYLGPTASAPATVFVVPQQSAEFDVPDALFRAHIIQHKRAFDWLYGLLVAGKTTAPGGYRLHGGMFAWDVIRTLTIPPSYVWVSVRPGLRKEQIGRLLSEKLAWSPAQRSSWDAVFTGEEGSYFPDTYLLPRDEPAPAIAKRFINRFNEKIAPYASSFASRHMSTGAATTIASLIQREAAGPTDMPIISGIIQNRLDKGMPLQIDATIQYIKGNERSGWWPIVKGQDTSIVSPYNTYLNTGLPPTPIANPGLSAIAAAANPAKTACLYYLHDDTRQIHCAVTYAEHLSNIQKYLE